MSNEQTIAEEVIEERRRQDAKWGEQNHPDGTGGRPLADMSAISYNWLDDNSAQMLAEVATQATDQAAEEGTATWRDILLEEVFEALAEEDPGKLRVELIQVAAVVQQWVQAIDRRTGDR